MIRDYETCRIVLDGAAFLWPHRPCITDAMRFNFVQSLHKVAWSAGVMYPFADGTEKIRLCKSEKRSLLIMEHTVDEIKEIIESDSDMAPRNKLNAL